MARQAQKFYKQKFGRHGTRLEIFFISKILAVLCYKGTAPQVNAVKDPFKTYLQALQTALTGGDASEHTYRTALKALLEALEPGAGVGRTCG